MSAIIRNPSPFTYMRHETTTDSNKRVATATLDPELVYQVDLWTYPKHSRSPRATTQWTGSACKAIHTDHDLQLHPTFFLVLHLFEEPRILGWNSPIFMSSRQSHWNTSCHHTIKFGAISQIKHQGKHPYLAGIPHHWKYLVSSCVLIISSCLSTSSGFHHFTNSTIPWLSRPTGFLFFAGKHHATFEGIESHRIRAHPQSLKGLIDKPCAQKTVLKIATTYYLRLNQLIS